MINFADENIEQLLEKLRYGTAPEQIEAATALGNTGNMQVIPPLRRALKRLKRLEPYPTITETGDISDLAYYDPDSVLRATLLDAITKLLLGKSNDSNSSPVELRQVITQVITLTDGSQLTIIVKAPTESETCLAGKIYNERLIPVLKQIETIKD